MSNITKYITFNPDTPIVEPTDDSPYFRAKPGENLLRIIPIPMEWAERYKSVGLEPTPFVPVPKHFYERPGSGTAPEYVSTQCPKKLGHGPCPICKESDILRASADEGDRELGWDMAAKPKRLVNVIVRGMEAAGPKIWELSTPMGKPKGMTMYEKLVAAMSGSAGADLIDPINGFDVVVNKHVTGKGRTGTSYTVSAARQSTPLGTPAQIAEWMESQEDLLIYRSAPDPELILRMMRGEKAERAQPSHGGHRPSHDAPQYDRNANSLPAASAQDEDEFAF